MSKILLVEDEDHLAQGLAFNLRNQGYEVTVIDDGRKALDLLERRTFDLIVLDVMLPGTEGTEVARARRRNGDWTPILMLTAKDDQKDVITGIEAGADDYIAKPFDLDELLARIRGLLRRQAWTRAKLDGRSGSDVGPVPDEEPEPLKFGQCTVDFKTLRARGADGEEAELSPKEAAIMRLFAAHPDEVISRARLLEDVWGLKGSLQTRTVDNFILRLRKRFETRPDHPKHILSVRGAGYRFKP
ncbi:response regulator transcription factor [bacterium]|nr:response regulator transcription factor [bacterium]